MAAPACALTDVRGFVLVRSDTKNARVRRELLKREPQVVENTKQALLLKGPKCSLAASRVLTDLTVLKKPDAKLFQKRNLTRPFEDQTSVEFLCGVNDAALFGFASHSKKRPHNLVRGRGLSHWLACAPAKGRGCV